MSILRQRPGSSIVRQISHFCLIGLINTAVYYVFYRLFLPITPYLIAHIFAWFIATLISYFLNAKYTFNVRPSLRTLTRFPISSLVNLIVSTLASGILVSGMQIDQRWGTLIGGIIAIPFTFFTARIIMSESTAP